jgi:hypothetical protein
MTRILADFEKIELNALSAKCRQAVWAADSVS